MPDVVVPGFLISLTGICTSACRIFMSLCRVFTLGVPDISTQECRMFKHKNAAYFHIVVPDF
jgi:hypothetical protein